MRETFPHKSKGDTLSADHINRLSDVARRLASGQTGSYLYGNDQQLAGPIPFIQRLMIVTEVPFDAAYEGCNDDTTLYKVKPRYYDHDAAEWKTDDDSEDVCLDADAVGLIYQVNDVVTAWYDPQRGAYIPLSSALIIAKTTVAHDKDQTQDIEVYQGVSQGNLMASGKKVAAHNRFADLDGDKWVAAARIGSGWELIAGEC